MDELIFAIGTCQKNVEKRHAVRNTWCQQATSRNLGYFFYQANAPLDKDDIYGVVAVGGQDDYYHFLEKTILAFEYALERYKYFQWLFKCDDDTYVHVQRLIELIQRHPTADLIGNDFITKHGHASGGAGYVLSRAMVEAVVGNKDEFLKRPNELEDVAITGWMRKQTRKFVSTCKLRHYHDEVPTKLNDRITGHHLTPENMYATATALFNLRDNF